MVESIIKSFDVWTDAQGIKSKGRVKSIENISLEGIAHLRELILELAVHGKLVRQDENDEPASELLKRVEKEESNLIKKEKLKKEKALPEITEKEKAFDVPTGWIWTRLGTVSADIHYGYTASANHQHSDVRLLRITDIQDDKVDWETVPGCDIDKKQLPNYLLQDGDILIARTGGTIGKSYLVSGISIEAVFASYLIRVKKLSSTYPEYIKIFLRSPLYWVQLYESSMGTGQPNVNGNALKHLKLPLPPLAEQRRIVAKVEELMALCDKLEEAQTLHLKTHQTLVKTVLQTLTDASDTAEVEKAWQRLCPHFDTLFCTEDSIDQLKQTVLQLAIMGRLVKQDPNDEPAGELLKRIEKEKAKAIKEGRLKKQAPLPEIGEEEKPFASPRGWEWVRLGEIIELISGQHVEAADWNDKKDGYPYLTGPSDFGDINPIFSRWTKKPKVFAMKGDILITVKGSGVGKLNLLHEDDVAIGRQLMAVRVSFLEREFVSLFLQNNFQVFQNDKMGIAIPGISREDILEKAFPLPPLPEQKRIVSKVSELMKFCEQLKSQIKKSEDTKLLLSKTIVENAIV